MERQAQPINLLSERPTPSPSPRPVSSPTQIGESFMPMPTYTPDEVFALERDLSGFSYRELEKETGVSASRLCLHETGKAVLSDEQLDVVKQVLHSAIRERARLMMPMLATG
jgi:hypothetical protein